VCEAEVYEAEVQGGEDPQDALSVEVIFCKRALQVVALLRQMTCNFRHPMGLRHPICEAASGFSKRES